MPAIRPYFLLLCLTAVSAPLQSTHADEPWWHRYPVYVGDVGAGSYDETTPVNLHAAMVSGNYGADPTWGPYGQAVSFLQTLRHFEKIQSEGVRWITWMEAFGDSMLYAAALDRQDDGSFRPHPGDSHMAALSRMAWNWEADGVRPGNAYRWVGLHNTVNDEDFVVPRFAREQLGFPTPHYPDGSQAVGYLPEGQYPLNARVYDAVCVSDINGQLTIDLEMLPERANRIDPETGQREASTEGLYRATVDRNRARYFRDRKIGDDVFASVMLVGKDPAAPFWTDYARVMARQLVEHGVDGLWCDNYSCFNNFGMPPIRNGFGRWSEHRFRERLPQWFTAQELAELLRPALPMNERLTAEARFHRAKRRMACSLNMQTSIKIEDAAQFDVKTYLKHKAVEFGAKDPSDYWDPAWRDGRWQDDPVWNAYKVFKQQIGQEALRSFYEAVKAEARAAGREDFLISGNDMPVYALGWARDEWLDMVSSEQTPGWFVTTGSRGIMLPPLGKYAVVYRAGLEHQKGPYATVWYYLNGPQQQYRNRPTLAKVLFAEGLANATFLKYGGNPALPGTPESVGWWNEFVRTNEGRIGRREIRADVGLYFSPDNQLAFVVPGSHALDHDRQPHSFGHWGFGTALIDGHVPYRVVTDWKLSAQALAGLKTLIVPSTECLDDDDVAVFETWVRNGGRLVVTGPCGARYSVAGRFAHRETPVVVRWFPDAVDRLSATSAISTPAKAAAAGSDPTVPLADLSNTSPATPASPTGTSPANSPSSRTSEVALGDGRILWSPEPIGMDYYLHETERATRLGEILDLVGPSELLDPGGLPATIGVYLWQSLDKSALHADLVNYDLDLETDRIHPAENLSFRLQIPDGWKSVDVETITPDGTPSATCQVEDAWVRIQMDRLVHYGCIKIARGSGEVGQGQ